MNEVQRLSLALADRYSLERELGRGGMATVYLAHDVAGDRKVAIKVLRSDLTALLGTERFLREIQIAAQLDHPHVVGLIDSGTLPAESGESQGGLYYVMPYIDGESLRDRMLREPQFPLDATIDIARQVADVLDYANGKGLVHRDIKPENILLAGDQVFVTDFGIARAVGDAGGARLTETGLTIGTPAYMSPEQSLSETIDARTDVYALGCVVYELLVGEPPYTGPTSQAIIARRLSEPLPSIRVVRDGLPKSVEAAIHRALARTAADRFTTAGEFIAALASPANEPSGPSRRRVAAMVAAVALLLLVGGWFALRSAPTASARVIAVLPLSTAPANDSALGQLGRALVSTLSADLGQVSGMRTVDVGKVMGASTNTSLAAYGPAAIDLGRKVGARSVLFGDVRGMGNGRVQVNLKLLAADSSGDTLAVVTVTGNADSITALTDSLSLGLLHQVWRRGSPPTPSFASITTRSIPALAAFLQGERLSTSGRWADAALAYDAAFRLDSTFWLAAWRHNEAQQWIPGEPDQNDTLQLKYQAHIASFGERDQLLIGGEATSATEPYAAHIKRFQDVSERFPADWAARFPFADHLVHGGPLIGWSGAAVRDALAKTAALNPQLTNVWQHLYSRSAGRDSVLSTLALSELVRLGDTLPPLGTPPVVARLAAMRDDDPPAAAFDSAATFIRRLRPNEVGSALALLGQAGYPGRQITLARLLLRDPPRDTGSVAIIRNTIAAAWAARGVWDSALVTMGASGASALSGSPIELYRLSVIGAWLGGLAVKDAGARRAAAAAYVAERGDGPATKVARGRFVMADAMLAILRSDTAALAAQRKALRATLGDSPNAAMMDRTLAAYQLMRANKRGAADSLAAIDLAMPEEGLLVRDGLTRSVDHLGGATALLAIGDTARALKLLTWHEADVPAATFAWFAPIAYLWLARIAEAQHHKAEAIYFYRQFLQRYDFPTPLIQPDIDEARHALGRLYGLTEPGRTR